MSTDHMQNSSEKALNEMLIMNSEVRVSSSAWMPDLKCEIQQPCLIDESIFDPSPEREDVAHMASSQTIQSDDYSVLVDTASNIRFDPDAHVDSMSVQYFPASESSIVTGTHYHQQEPPTSVHDFQFPSYPLFLPDDGKRVATDFSGMSTEDDTDTRLATEFSIMSVATNDDLQPSNNEEFLDSKPESKPSTTILTNTNLLLVDNNDIKLWDILHDGGDKSTNHAGNIRFRNVVQDLKEKYGLTTPVNEQSMKDVSRCIVAYVTSYGGRFLQQIPGSNNPQWNIMTTDEATTATYQVLQELMRNDVQQVSTVAVKNENPNQATTNEASTCPMQVGPTPPGTEIHNDHVLPTDILAGRGAKSYSHPGNVTFRSVVDSMREIYRAKSNNKDKTILAISFVNIMKKKHNARFLKKKSSAESEEMWVVMDDDESRLKVSQALREKASRV